MRIKRILILTAVIVALTVLFFVGILGLLNIHLVDLFPVHMQWWVSTISRWLALPIVLCLFIPAYKIAKVAHRRIIAAKRAAAVIPPQENDSQNADFPFNDREVIEVNPQSKIEFEVLDQNPEEKVATSDTKLEQTEEISANTPSDDLVTEHEAESSTNPATTPTPVETSVVKEDPVVVQFQPVTSSDKSDSDVSISVDPEKEVAAEIEPKKLSEVDVVPVPEDQDGKTADPSESKTPLMVLPQGKGGAAETPSATVTKTDGFPESESLKIPLDQENTQILPPARTEEIFLSLKNRSSKGRRSFVVVEASQPVHQDLSVGIQVIEVLDYEEDPEDSAVDAIDKSSIIIHQGRSQSDDFPILREDGVTKTIFITPFDDYSDNIDENEFPKHSKSLDREIKNVNDIIFRRYKLVHGASKLVF